MTFDHLQNLDEERKQDCEKRQEEIYIGFFYNKFLHSFFSLKIKVKGEKNKTKQKYISFQGVKGNFKNE